MEMEKKANYSTKNLKIIKTFLDFNTLRKFLRFNFNNNI